MRVLALSGGKDSMACLFLKRNELECAIYVDTGYHYPEQAQIIEYAATLIPVHTVHADRAGQNAVHGIPSEVVPVDWTVEGEAMTTPKLYHIQPYMHCCYENIAAPLMRAAKTLGATVIVSGQRDNEAWRATSKDGDTVDGIVRSYPIHDWTSQQVMEYLSERMPIPPHYTFTHTSLDCYDCTAFTKASHDRLAWTAERYPAYYHEYRKRRALLDEAIKEALLC